MKVYLQRLVDHPFLTKWFKSVYVSLAKSSSVTNALDEADYVFLGVDSSCEVNWPQFGDDNPSYVHRYLHGDEQPYIWGTTDFVYDLWTKPLNPVVHRVDYIFDELHRYLQNLRILPHKKYVLFFNHPFIGARKNFLDRYGDNFYTGWHFLKLAQVAHFGRR